jgi:hypothetical protein
MLSIIFITSSMYLYSAALKIITSGYFEIQNTLLLMIVTVPCSRAQEPISLIELK